MAYESGRRDGNDRRRRIAYTYDGLSALQLPNGEIRPASSLVGRTFFVFATPRVPTELDPQARPGEFVLAHPAGIAELTQSGELRFGDNGRAPVSADGNPDHAPRVDIGTLRRSVRD